MNNCAPTNHNFIYTCNIPVPNGVLILLHCTKCGATLNQPITKSPQPTPDQIRQALAPKKEEKKEEKPAEKPKEETNSAKA